MVVSLKNNRIWQSLQTNITNHMKSNKYSLFHLKWKTKKILSSLNIRIWIEKCYFFRKISALIMHNGAAKSAAIIIVIIIYNHFGMNRKHLLRFTFSVLHCIRLKINIIATIIVATMKTYTNTSYLFFVMRFGQIFFFFFG